MPKDLADAMQKLIDSKLKLASIRGEIMGAQRVGYYCTRLVTHLKEVCADLELKISTLNADYEAYLRDLQLSDWSVTNTTDERETK